MQIYCSAFRKDIHSPLGRIRALNAYGNYRPACPHGDRMLLSLVVRDSHADECSAGHSGGATRRGVD